MANTEWTLKQDLNFSCCSLVFLKKYPCLNAQFFLLSFPEKALRAYESVFFPVVFLSFQPQVSCDKGMLTLKLSLQEVSSIHTGIVPLNSNTCLLCRNNCCKIRDFTQLAGLTTYIPFINVQQQLLLFNVLNFDFTEMNWFKSLICQF